MSDVLILIVEDELIVARDLEDTLLGLGYKKPIIVSTGEAAVEKAREHKPDLVLMDIMLGGKMDGVTAAGEIKSMFNIPVLYLTAYSNPEVLTRAKKTKPYGYILKPFEEKDLSTSIEIALYKNEIERKLISDTENALATIIGSTELLLEEGTEKHSQETIRKINVIKNAASIIKEIIEEF